MTTGYLSIHGFVIWIWWIWLDLSLLPGRSLHEENLMGMKTEDVEAAGYCFRVRIISKKRAESYRVSQSGDNPTASSKEVSSHWLFVAHTLRAFFSFSTCYLGLEKQDGWFSIIISFDPLDSGTLPLTSHSLEDVSSDDWVTSASAWSSTISCGGEFSQYSKGTALENLQGMVSNIRWVTIFHVSFTTSTMFRGCRIFTPPDTTHNRAEYCKKCNRSSWTTFWTVLL